MNKTNEIEQSETTRLTDIVERFLSLLFIQRICQQIKWKK